MTKREEIKTGVEELIQEGEGRRRGASRRRRKRKKRKTSNDGHSRERPDARGVQKGDRLWALFDKDEHGQEWWGGTVIQADLNSRRRGR